MPTSSGKSGSCRWRGGLMEAAQRSIKGLPVNFNGSFVSGIRGLGFSSGYASCCPFVNSQGEQE